MVASPGPYDVTNHLFDDEPEETETTEVLEDVAVKLRGGQEVTTSKQISLKLKVVLDIVYI